jgi:predicted branched-subunit amino acid permease
MNRDRIASFAEGARAAIPICFAFFAITFTLGITAHAAGLPSGELLLMSVVVFAGPAQFPAVDLLPLGGHGLQILVSTVFINLRFSVMGFALAPHFKRVRTAGLTLGAQLVTGSTFAVSFLRFQRRSGEDNFIYFLGVAIPSYACYLAGTVVGYYFGVGIPSGFDEAIQFIFPAYLAALLASELRERRMIVVAGVAFLATPLAERLVPGWGLIVNAIVVATGAIGVEAWWESTSQSS